MKKNFATRMYILDNPNTKDLMREIAKAKDDLAAAETVWAWADPEHVDTAIALVDSTRARYQSLVRQYRDLYSK